LEEFNQRYRHKISTIEPAEGDYLDPSLMLFGLAHQEVPLSKSRASTAKSKKQSKFDLRHKSMFDNNDYRITVPSSTKENNGSMYLDRKLNNLTKHGYAKKKSKGKRKSSSISLYPEVSKEISY